jgi:hypothetical protein
MALGKEDRESTIISDRSTFEAHPMPHDGFFRVPQKNTCLLVVGSHVAGGVRAGRTTGCRGMADSASV